MTLATVTSISLRASKLLWKYELMGNSFPCGGFPRNMEPGRAKGTENSCSHSFRVVSSAEFSLEPSDRSFTESSCFRTKPRIAWRSAWYSCGWTFTVKHLGQSPGNKTDSVLSDLVCVPNKINIVTGNKKCLGVLLLQVEIHLVPPHAVHVELLVAEVGQ